MVKTPGSQSSLALKKPLHDKIKRFKALGPITIYTVVVINFYQRMLRANEWKQLPKKNLCKFVRNLKFETILDQDFQSSSLLPKYCFDCK